MQPTSFEGAIWVQTTGLCESPIVGFVSSSIQSFAVRKIVDWVPGLGAMEVLARARVSAASSVSSVVGSDSTPRNSLPVCVSFRPSSALAGSIVASLSSVPSALALSYEDFVNGVDKATSATNSGAPDGSFVIDFDAAADFMTANPMALVAGLAAVAVPLVAFRALASPQTFGSVSAVEAFNKLSNPETNAQLLDIRAVEDVKAEGVPNLKSLKKKVTQVAYSGEANSFLDKVLAKYQDSETTTLYILDGLDGSSLAAAKLLANSGFQGAYAIKGGVEAWQSNELPWVMPRKGLFDGLKDILNGSDTSSIVPATIGVAAAAGIGATVFTEAETVLQLLGSVAFIQIFAKKFLFAKDREQTIKEVSSFLDTKVAPKGLADDLKEVGRVLLPKSGEVKAAVANGEKVLEKKLKVESVTPEALAAKAAEKVGA
ncbi:hypothetical protein KC19_3G135200 [Ceratodon purpureus]|uniref:Rhodanese domain-containing protein n=1 Tax=Ceratodon purpureus TaxID=3225 RepID=A0A8T0II15_CERPU|nr:hypothetical protein KC19_3G135200 [Ceratodon purpureus]